MLLKIINPLQENLSMAINLKSVKKIEEGTSISDAETEDGNNNEKESSQINE
jgi:hypothetical protein